MPQDELWAASARLTGWTMHYLLDVKTGEEDQLNVAPTWSKRPPDSRSGAVRIGLDPCFRWYVPDVIKVAHQELLGGLASNVPGVVRAELRAIQDGFQGGWLC